MREMLTVAAVPLLLSQALLAQQPASPPPPQPQPIVIFRIDLVPTGSVFAMNEPKLEGDTYVFRILPERTLERLPKARVKAVTQRSRDFEKAFIWEVALSPTGRMLTYEEPVLKGKTYLVKPWKGGETLVSVRKDDVRKVTRLTGMDAFKAEEEELGVRRLEGEIPDGPLGGTVHGSAPAPAAGAAPGGTPAEGNWQYQGKPGVTDAYAPPSATVTSPGDVPRAPPTPAPR